MCFLINPSAPFTIPKIPVRSLLSPINDVPLPGMDTPLTLSELNSQVKSALETQLEPSYWVIAEIGQMQLAQRGHAYLELVEKVDDQVTAKLRANIWAYTYRVISGWFESVTGHPLQAGLKVLVHAQVTFHEVYGLSLNIRDIDPNFTLGERARRRMEVLQKLEADGVMDMNRELTLPLVPQRIAVISSPTAAGYEDFMQQLAHNSFGYRYTTRLYRAVMQGNDAAESIIQALHAIHNAEEGYDAVVIIRGGGSQLDLDCFDDYELAATVAQFPLPVITGIGHERDESIVDLVAHTKMKTPTAVAEFLIQGLRAFEEGVLLLGDRLQRYISQYVSEQGMSLRMMGQRMGSAARAALQQRDRKLEQQALRLASGVKATTRQEAYRLESLQKTLQKVPGQQLTRQREQLANLAHTLEILNPQALLRRGYSLTLVDGQPLPPGQAAAEGQTLTTYTASQVLTSQITKTEPNPYGEADTDV